jgi:hypothetical protein
MRHRVGVGLSSDCELLAHWQRDHAYHKTQINFATVELMLMLRIWVLYARSKRIGALMAVAFLVTIGAGLALRKVQPRMVTSDVVIRESSSSLELTSAHDFAAPLTVTICKRSPPSEYFWGYLFGIALEVHFIPFLRS